MYVWVHVFSDDLIIRVSKDDLRKNGDILRGESENKYKKSLNYSYKKGNHNSPDHDQSQAKKKSCKECIHEWRRTCVLLSGVPGLFATASLLRAKR